MVTLKKVFSIQVVLKCKPSFSEFRKLNLLLENQESNYLNQFKMGKTEMNWNDPKTIRKIFLFISFFPSANRICLYLQNIFVHRLQKSGRHKMQFFSNINATKTLNPLFLGFFGFFKPFQKLKYSCTGGYLSAETLGEGYYTSSPRFCVFVWWFHV